jgi:sec-independent protein translocase protein TatA
MGLGGISIWQLLIILVIVLLLFGTKRLSSLGGDLGGAIKGFKKALKDDQESTDQQKADAADTANTEATDDKKDHTDPKA